MCREEVLCKLQQNRKTINDSDDFRVNEAEVIALMSEFEKLLYPKYYPDPRTDEALFDDVTAALEKILSGVLEAERVGPALEEFLTALPEITLLLNEDAHATYGGDPAAKTIAEVVMTYPGFKAVFGYRLAHKLYELNVPVIPRIIAEYYHGMTGIDINPGAKIGKGFCIDHGTGIVIGETTEIGEYVRMYHGVTLGNNDFTKTDSGDLLKGGKRHPNIGNHVVIFANATILGGDTTIGDYCVIGSNTWIKKSVKAGDVVTIYRDEEWR